MKLQKRLNALGVSPAASSSIVEDCSACGGLIPHSPCRCRSKRRASQTHLLAKRLEYMVFVSHATVDKFIAVTICDKIEATGATVFRDDCSIRAGDKIPEKLRDAITQCREMIALFSPASGDRAWVHAEIGAAWLLRKRIVPVLCHTDFDSIPTMLSSEKAVNVNDLGAYCAELRERVRDHRAKSK